MTAPRPLVCTPEALHDAMRAVAFYAVEHHLAHEHQADSNDVTRRYEQAEKAVAALFRPAEEPDPLGFSPERLAQGEADVAAGRVVELGDALQRIRDNPPSAGDRPGNPMPASAPVAPPQAEERKEWPPKRPKPVALIPTPTCSEERDPWGNAESRVRTLAHEANNEAGADVAIHLFRAAYDAALAALRSELSASQREVERLRQQLDPPTQSGSFGATTAKVAGKCIQCNGDIYHDPHHIGEYLHVCVPSGENRSEG